MWERKIIEREKLLSSSIDQRRKELFRKLLFLEKNPIRQTEEVVKIFCAILRRFVFTGRQVVIRKFPGVENFERAYRVVAGEIARVQSGKVGRLQSALLPVAVAEYAGTVGSGYQIPEVLLAAWFRRGRRLFDHLHRHRHRAVRVVARGRRQSQFRRRWCSCRLRYTCNRHFYFFFVLCSSFIL